MRVSSAANSHGRHHLTLDAARAPVASQLRTRSSNSDYRTNRRRVHSSFQSHQSAICRSPLSSASTVACLSFPDISHNCARAGAYQPYLAPGSGLEVVVFPSFFVPASPAAFTAPLGDNFATLLVQDKLTPFLAVLAPLLLAFAQVEFKFAFTLFFIGPTILVINLARFGRGVPLRVKIG